MYTKTIFAAGALLSVVAAVPMVKRDVVWVTETAEDVVTVPVTTTVWVNPGETIPTGSASTANHFGHHHSSHRTTHVKSTVTVSSVAESSVETSPAETSTTVAPSSYVAPTTSTTEAAPTTPSTTSTYVAPTTSSTSEYVAPTTSSTSEYVAPTTSATSTYVAPTTSTSSAPAATSTYSSGGGSNTGDAAPGTEYTGDLTWYDVGLGACGITSESSQSIVAIAESLFDEYTPTTGIHAGNPNMNTLCGKQVSITGKDGSAYTATIVDRCTGCKKSDLDLSEDFFNSVTDNGNGRVHNMSWKFM